MSNYGNETLDLDFSSADDDNLMKIVDRQRTEIDEKSIEIERLKNEKLGLEARLCINKFPSLLVSSLISISSIIIYKLLIEKALIRLVNSIYNCYLSFLEWIRHLLEKINGYWISLKKRWKGKDDDQLFDQLESPQELIYD